MDINQQIALRLESLPAEKLQEVLDFVEFLVARASPDNHADQPFRGVPAVYLQPTEPVADEDWGACR